MNLEQNAIYVLIGAAIGLGSSGIGALFDYLVARSRKKNVEGRLPSCIWVISGMLGFVGLGVTILSFFLTGGIGPALLIGLGVFAGFTTAFTMLSVGWLLFHDRKPLRKLSDESYAEPMTLEQKKT